MKKYITLTITVILAIAMIFTLVACGGGDTTPTSVPAAETQIATPEATPTPTPEPTPEPCQHEWTEADCENPEICSLCGETQGEPLGHDFTEANYQESSICLICDAEGEGVITPGAVSNGLKIITDIGVPHQFVTMDRESEVIGEATLVDVRTSDSYEGLEAKEGYEFIIADMVLKFSQPFGYIEAVVDYYTFTPSSKGTGILDDGRPVIFGSINHYGVVSEYSASLTFNLVWSGQAPNRVGTLDMTFATQVPIGYDGAMIALSSYKFAADRGVQSFDDIAAQLEGTSASDVFDSDTLFFRLRGR